MDETGVKSVNADTEVSYTELEFEAAGERGQRRRGTGRTREADGQVTDSSQRR
jgi:hypothetical protein